MLKSIDESKNQQVCIVRAAIDQNGEPVSVRGLVIETENEKLEWQGGEKRYKLRKSRRREGY